MSWRALLLLLLLQVEEQRVSGGVDLTYFHEPIGSIYQGLGNVMLRLAPNDQPAAANTTLLLNAHYDSTLGSQGQLSPPPLFCPRTQSAEVIFGRVIWKGWDECLDSAWLDK